MNQVAPIGADATSVHHRRIALAVAVASVVSAGLSAAGTAAAAGPAAGAKPVRTWSPLLRATTSGSAVTNPTTNIAPSPDYWPACSQSGASSQQCIDAVVAAIDHARALEGVPAMLLPPGFASMTPAVQTFVVSNLERVDRGLRAAAGMVDTLNSASTTAAAEDADPTLSSWTVGPFSADRWGSIWAGDLNALAADYDWMYNDGWGPSGSYNLDCTSATASGCWGHRDNILSPYGGEEVITGVGSVAQSQWTSIAQIFVAGSGSYPAFTTAWSAIAGTAPPQTASPAAAAPAVDATAASATGAGTIVAGQSRRITGRLTDAVTGAPLTGVTVHVCHRAVTSTTTSCTTSTTATNGTVSMTVRPSVTTVYWVGFGGTATHAAARSAQARVDVRAAVTLRAARAAGVWRVTAHITPARGQVVRLQQRTTRGWLTVRRVVARTWLSFGSLRSGTYRLVVSTVAGSLGTVAGVRAA